jgi:signal transduction histidine kinase
MNRPDSSLSYLYKALAAFAFFNQPEKINRVYGSLYQLYKENSQHDSAYMYLQLHQSLGDSLAEKEKKQIHSSQNIAFNKQIEQQNLESKRLKNANTNRTYAFVTGIAILLLIAFLLLRNNRSRRKANSLLQKQNAEIEEQKTKVETTLAELKLTQAQLIQSEKMASLGELTAGIAHEIQNPLNFINNFSEINNEMLDEAHQEMDKGNSEEVKNILRDIKGNSEKINHHGKRADAIVKGMLQHSQSSKGQKEPTDINTLADEYLRLAFHGLRAKDKSFNVTIKTDFDKSIENINIIPQDIGRVILNLISNSFYAVDEKKKTGLVNYEPTVSMTTKKIEGKVQIEIGDNGNGISQNIVDKIFQPFFTTKPTGQGTGLGLSLAYDIIKAHGGELKVETTEGQRALFIIQLPASYA